MDVLGLFLLSAWDLQTQSDCLNYLHYKLKHQVLVAQFNGSALRSDVRAHRFWQEQLILATE